MSETPITISVDTARRMLLAVQGMASPPARRAKKADVLDAIRRMGALQIDTIHVVARSPYLVLFSRLGAYDPDWLDELLDEGRLFEYWAHAACFLPVEDYPLYVSRMERLTQRWYPPEWVKKHQAVIKRVLAVIQAEGEVRSADFERTDGRKGAWWDWKEEKRVLEYLHTTGALMIARRERFQRVYDLRERVLPDWDPAQALALDEAEDALAERAVRRLGAAPARWAADYFRQAKQGMPARLERLARSGRLIRVAVVDQKEPWYVHPENRALLEHAVAGELEPSVTALLSPFDPIVWDRDRARVLFNFDYTIECYTPAARRIYGYFSLPILCGEQLIGRLDAKAHRKEGIFEVRALHLEPGARLHASAAEDVRAAIQRCADWHGTPQVIIRRSQPESFAKMLDGAEPPDALRLETGEHRDLQDLF